MNKETELLKKIENQIERARILGRINQIQNELEFIDEEFAERDLWRDTADILNSRRSFLKGIMKTLFEEIHKLQEKVGK